MKAPGHTTRRGHRVVDDGPGVLDLGGKGLDLLRAEAAAPSDEQPGRDGFPGLAGALVPAGGSQQGKEKNDTAKGGTGDGHVGASDRNAQDHRGILRAAPGTLRILLGTWTLAASAATPPRADTTVVLAVGAPPPGICENWTICSEDYLRLPTLALDHAVPRSEQDLRADLAAARSAPRDAGGLRDDELRPLILDALNLGFLLDGFDSRPLLATTVLEREDGDWTEEVVVLDDPWVGAFQIRILRPLGAGPFPAILALPGHSESSSSHLGRLGADQWVQDGVLVAALDWRVDEADALEDQIVHALLAEGFSLLGLRIYEAIVTTRYLRARPDVDGTRLALIGHSGGSAVGNLLIRVDDRYQAYVSDMASSHDSVSAQGLWLCDTVPALAGLAGSIRAMEGALVPTLSVPYGYEGQIPAIRAWLAARLR